METRQIFIRHVLVQHQYEAEDLIRQMRSSLKSGSDFSEFAAKYSTCSSSRQGGDLGDLSKKLDKLDENFREACETMKVGSIAGPLRTRFGYHLIQRYG